jgi:hypothetical protein
MPKQAAFFAVKWSFNHTDLCFRLAASPKWRAIQKAIEDLRGGRLFGADGSRR